MENQNKRIAFIIGNLQRDGAERVISILGEHYCQRGWEVDILTLLNDKCEYTLNSHINIVPICRENKSYYKNIPFWIKGIRKYIKLRNPDKIVSFVARINILTLSACLGLKRNIIISERNDPYSDGRSYIVKFATGLLYPLADGIVFQTKRAQSYFSKKIQRKSEVILNPIQITNEASRDKEYKIVAIGRLSEQKNHLLLINAFKKVHDDFPEYKLYIYGEGSLREALNKQIKSLYLEKSVFLPGNVSDVHNMIKDAEIFVLSSNYEGLSNALLEAMMMGLPCISTNCAGSNEIIKHGKNGLLIPLESEYNLSEAIKLLIRNKEFSIKIGQEAKKTSELFKSDNIVEKWESVIEKYPVRRCDKKRILFIIPFLSSGGAERVVSIWCSELARMGNEIHLLVFYRVDDEYPIDDNVVLHIIKNKKYDYDNMTKIEKLKEIRNVFKIVKPTIVLPFVDYVGVMTTVSKIGLPIKNIETIRNNPMCNPQKRIQRIIRNISVLLSKRCIVQNKSQMEYFPKWMRKKMIILSNPISSIFIKKEKAYKPDFTKIVAVGRLEKQKNYPLLIKAFYEIAMKYENIVLSIYGEGSLHSELNNYINKLNLQGKVCLCGRTKNIEDELLQSDLYVLSSDWEGMPNSLMEAMAVGLPCISTDCKTGPAELIEDGVNGYLIPVDDKDALVNSIMKVINNTDNSIKMGKEARKTIIEKYSAEASSNNLMKFIESI